MTEYSLCTMLEGRACQRKKKMEAKHVRLQLFLERLNQAPPAESFEEAFRQIADILNEVENELTDISFDPDHWQTDGRMYPPQLDNVREVDANPRVRRCRTRAHNTFIGNNGAIEIQEGTGKGKVLLSKAGANGRTVWDQ